MPKKLPEPLVGVASLPEWFDFTMGHHVRLWPESSGDDFDIAAVLAPLPRALKKGETVRVTIVKKPAKKRRAKPRREKFMDDWNGKGVAE